MQSQSPTPLEALRGHSHAVVFAPRDGGLWSSIGPTIEAAGIDVEVIGHPLLCMSALCWREFNGRRPGSRESTAFVAVDVDDIEQLAPLFTAIRSRLPHVSAWVIASNVVIRVIEGKPRLDASTQGEPRHAVARTELETKHAAPHRSPPKLRIARSSAPDESGAGAAAVEANASLSRENDLDQIEAILRGRGGTSSSGIASAPASSLSSRSSEDEVDAADPEEPSATRLTSDEIAMLMGDLDDDRPARDRGGSDPDGRRTR